MNLAQAEHPQAPAHVDNCLPCAIARAKQQLGMDTAQAGMIAPLLPEHLRQPFWRQAVERYLADRLAAIGEEEQS